MKKNLELERLDVQADTSIKIMENVPDGVYYLSKICHFNKMIKSLLMKIKVVGRQIEQRLHQRQEMKNQFNEDKMKQFRKCSVLIHATTNRAARLIPDLDLNYKLEEMHVSEEMTQEETHTLYQDFIDGYLELQQQVLDVLCMHLLYKQELLTIV